VPVGPSLTEQQFNDDTSAAELIGGAPSRARAEISRRDPKERNRAIFRDVRDVSEGASTAVATGHPIALVVSLLFSAAANAATNEAAEMGETLAEIVIEDLVDDGLVMLPRQAAFALPPQPRGREPAARTAAFEPGPAFADEPAATGEVSFADDPLFADQPMVSDGARADLFEDDGFGEAASDEVFFDEDPAYALPDEPEPAYTPVTVASLPDFEPLPPAPDAAADGLPLGVYASESDAEDEAEWIARFSSDVAPASALEVAPGGDGYTLTAVGLAPSAARMLCARRKIEGKPCG